MIINKAILHIFDFASDVFVLSQKELDTTSSVPKGYIEKTLARIASEYGSNSGVFSIESKYLAFLKAYISNQMDFTKLSEHTANTLFEKISQSDKSNSSDLLFIDYEEGNNRYIAILLLCNKEAYTHYVCQDKDVVYNELIKHKAILPSPSQKIDSFAIVCLDNMEIRFLDKRRYISGKDCFVFSDMLLECSSSISGKETMTLVTKVATKIAEEHGLNPTTVLSRAKVYVKENSEISENISPENIGQEIFLDSQELQQEFQREIAQLNLPKEVKIDKTVAARTGKNHKIKTDTGIEITFPAEYFENHNFMEFINNPDGTISIQLKNIGKIINK